MTQTINSAPEPGAGSVPESGRGEPGPGSVGGTGAAPPPGPTTASGDGPPLGSAPGGGTGGGADSPPFSLPPLLAELSRTPGRAPGLVAAVLGGALAAGLGLGAVAALAIVLWVGSPFPDGGVDGALHIAAALWLLAHGTVLTRADTLSGVPAPVGVTPLLLLALPMWLAYRAGFDAACPAGRDGVRGRGGAGGRGRTRDTLRTAGASGVAEVSGAGGVLVVPPARLAWPSAWSAWGGVVLGYLLVAGAAAAYADGGGLRPSWTVAALRLPLLVMAAVAVGVWRARGRLRAGRAPARRLQDPARGAGRVRRRTERAGRRTGQVGRRAGAVRGPGRAPWWPRVAWREPDGGPADTDRWVVGADGRVIGTDRWVVGTGGGLGVVAGPSGQALARRRLRAAARAAGAATLVLLAGGALLALVPLVRHEMAARTAFLRLADDGPGRAAVLVLVLALLPNVAVWGAAFALGPGFLLGSGHLVAPLVAAPVPLLPGAPSLALFPAQGYGAPVSWAAGAVPLAAGLTLAWYTVEAAAPAYGERDEAWGWVRTVLVTMAAAAFCGLAVAGLSALAGGPMGVAELARLGPVWWRTGAAATAWTLVAGVPAAVLLRSLRVRVGWRWPRTRQAEAW